MFGVGRRIEGMGWDMGYGKGAGGEGGCEEFEMSLLKKNRDGMGWDMGRE
jgi:hypothetical protein